jgi:hypothetical protein
MVHGKRIERNNSRLGEHAEVSVKICERLPDLSELNQFVANESRTVDILHHLWPAGAALHLSASPASLELDPIEYTISRIGNAVQSRHDETDRLRRAAGAGRGDTCRI